MNSKEIHDILYEALRVNHSAKLSHNIANTITTKVKSLISSEAKLIIKKLQSSNDPSVSTRVLSRDDVISELYQEIALATGKDKLAFITELNKLEDNYKGKTETDIHITLIDYGSAELSASVKAESVEQVNNITDLRGSTTNTQENP